MQTNNTHGDGDTAGIGLSGTILPSGVIWNRGNRISDVRATRKCNVHSKIQGRYTSQMA